jgi:hypothetical protein
MVSRRRMTAELGALGEASDETLALIRTLSRPVYVTVRRRWDEDEPVARWERAVMTAHRGYEMVYRNEEIAFFRFEDHP